MATGDRRLAPHAPYQVAQFELHDLNEVLRQVQLDIDELRGLTGENAPVGPHTHEALGGTGGSSTADSSTGTIISPPSFNTNQNNYNPAGWATAKMVRLKAQGSSRNITGFVATIDGDYKILHNIGGQNIVLKDSSNNSASINRLALTGDITMATNAVVIIQYDATDKRWRALST